MITLKGKILFDPVNKTKKHDKQSSWKKIVLIEFESEFYNNGICDYYAWFIKKRYSINLNSPLRKAHVSLINDSIKDIGDDIDKWDEFKRKYNNKEIEIRLNNDPRTDSNDSNSTGHWWLRICKESEKKLISIRNEIGLGKPFYPFHMTIGHANEKNIEQSKYIHRLIKKYGKEYN